jgi:hypothetical protein
MPSTPKGKHSAGAGKPGGPSKGQGGFGIIGKAGWKLLGRAFGWNNNEAPGQPRS